MRSHVTRRIKAGGWKASAVTSRLYTSLIRTCVLNLIAEMVISTPVTAQSLPNPQPELMDRQTEIALALSACPPSVANKAAVYVLEKSGYVKIRDSDNGFTAIVQHSQPTSQEPQCMDAEGTRSFLPRYLRIARWRAQGKSSGEIKRLTADAFANGTFQPPSKPGVDYMLSKENLVPNAKGEIVHFPPHVMFYAPYLKNADLGLSTVLGPDGNPEGPAFVAGEGSPNALIIVPLEDHRSPTPNASSAAVTNHHH